MAGILTITFSDIPAEGGNIDITGGGEITTFSQSRNTNKKVALKPDVASQAAAYAQSLEVDYNTGALSGQYTITYDATSVSIEHFDNTHFDSYTKTATNTTAAIATTTQGSTITLVDTYAENSSDKCTTIEMTLTFTVDVGGPVVGLVVTRQTGGGLVSLYSDAAHNSNTLVLAIPREGYYATTVVATIGSTSTSFNIFPPRYILSIDSVDVNSNPYSADVTINANTFLGSTSNVYALEENGISVPTYYNTNVFSGIVEGLYTAYVKDIYGCIKTESVTVEEGGNVIPIKSIWVSSKNSHFFADRTNRTVTTANVKNYLSFDDPYPVKAGNFQQVYSNEQSTTTQFWSSYPRHTANFTICDNDPNSSDIVVSLPITQRTDNINRDSYLEGTVAYDVTYGALKVSFIPGDVYDENGNVTAQHTYDGLLPDFYEVGTFIKINNYDGVITDIITVSSVQYAITNIFDALTSGQQIIHTIYTALDYEVFEFDLDFSTLLDKTGYITINAFENTTTTTVVKVFNSEFIKVISHADLVAGKWHICRFLNYNNDSEVNYTAWQDGVNVGGTRITHLRNIEFEMPLSPITNAEIKTEKLDNQVVKLDYESMEVFESGFVGVPKLYAKSCVKMFDESEEVNTDNIKMTTIAPAELESVGQYARPKVQLALIGSGNEFLRTGGVIKTYYPVRVS
jgi:hypothetical protein